MKRETWRGLVVPILTDDPLRYIPVVAT